MLQPYTALNSTLNTKKAMSVNHARVSYSQTSNAYSVQRKGYHPQAKTSFLRLNSSRSI